MAKYTKEDAVNILHKSAEKYNEKLSQKKFMLIYQDNLTGTVKSSVVTFKPLNFKHLTGIQSEIKPAQFFKACLKKRLSTRDFNFDRQGHAQRKLEVLPLMPEVFYNRCWLGPSINNDIYINADYYIGDTRCVLSIGIRTSSFTDVPVTLKKQSIREVVTKECKVYAIASMPLGDKEALWSLTYCEKGFDPEKWIKL